MSNMVPASNVQAAAVAGFFAAVIEHVCESYGVQVSPDVMASLPAFLAITVAHIWDICSDGTAKSSDQKPEQK